MIDSEIDHAEIKSGSSHSANDNRTNSLLLRQHHQQYDEIKATMCSKWLVCVFVHAENEWTKKYLIQIRKANDTHSARVHTNQPPEKSKINNHILYIKSLHAAAPRVSVSGGIVSYTIVTHRLCLPTKERTHTNFTRNKRCSMRVCLYYGFYNSRSMNERSISMGYITYAYLLLVCTCAPFNTPQNCIYCKFFASGPFNRTKQNEEVLGCRED